MTYLGSDTKRIDEDWTNASNKPGTTHDPGACLPVAPPDDTLGEGVKVDK